MDRFGPIKREKRLVIAARLIEEKRTDKWLSISKEVKMAVPGSPMQCCYLHMLLNMVRLV